MLNILWAGSLSNKSGVWEKFNCDTDLWVVSDVKSKTFLKNRIFETRSGVFGEPVMRASELWRHLLKKTDPGLTVIGPVGTEFLTKKFLEMHPIKKWLTRPGASKTFISGLQELGGILGHHDYNEIVNELEVSAEAPLLPEVLLLAPQFLEYVQSQRRIPWFMAPIILTHWQGEHRLPAKKIYFDLAYDLRPSERDLILTLSRNHDVSMVIPASGENELHEKGLSSYFQMAVGATQVSETELTMTKATAELSLWRHSSTLSEARNAASQISQWVKQGIAPTNIAVLAIDISAYEDLIAHDLGFEGMSINRAIEYPVQGLLWVQRLLAALRLSSGRIQKESLCLCFAEAIDPHLARPISQVEQIPNAAVKSQVLRWIQKWNRREISRKSFQESVFEICNEIGIPQEPAIVKAIYQAMTQLQLECPEDDRPFSDWVDCWAKLVAQSNFVAQPADSKGIWLLDLGSADDVPATHLIVLGCVDSKDASVLKPHLSSKQLLQLKQLGFDLSPTAVGLNDRLLTWLSSGPWETMIVSCPMEDGEGRTVSPGIFWLKLAARLDRPADQVDAHIRNQWVRLQENISDKSVQKYFETMRLEPEGTKNRQYLNVKSELEGTRKIQIDPARQSIRFGASNLEKLWNCPFIFFAEALLKLREDPDADLEPNALKKGQWVHQIIESIFENPPLDAWDQVRISDLIDQADPIQKALSGPLWESVNYRMSRVIFRFVQREIEMRKKYPHFKTLEHEIPLKGFVGWSDSGIKLSRDQKNQEQAAFSGFIDRIDVDDQGKTAVILDYKTGSSAGGPLASWAKYGEFQLFLYAKAVEAGLAAPAILDSKVEVVGAQYYLLKKLSRKEGFLKQNASHGPLNPAEFFEIPTFEEEELIEHFDRIEKELVSAFKAFESGDFSPNPKDYKKKECGRCHWRLSCRAEHLL
ncbi:MAG: PD-(D/E)XK nuclease family protein [Oligoflexia bacterium]|nr:PD-(D/E)XK nuclease family protein [Oligoflexia bacterium]